MISEFHTQQRKNTKIIGFSSTKGGSGKSTCACSIGAALSIRGYRVLIIDLDVPQYTTYRFFQNREKFLKNDIMLIKNIFFESILQHGKENDYRELLLELLEKEQATEYDFIIIDSGGYYNHLTKLTIEFSHVLITPINLSAIDFDILFSYNASIDNISEGKYTKYVRESKNSDRRLKWFVVPNRCHQIATQYQHKCLDVLRAMGDLIGYKVTSSIIDRSIYSQGFDRGITCFDSVESYFPNSQLTTLSARKEINSITDIILNNIETY